MKHYLLISLLTLTTSLLTTPNVQAKVYTCLKNDQVIYTSKPNGNCAVTSLPAIGKYSSPTRYISSNTASSSVRSRPRNVATRIATAYKGPQPSVNIVPRGSDGTRKAILQQELNNERNALAQAQEALNRSRTGKGGNITQLQSAVLDRQQNIQAIQRELSRM